MSVRKRKTGLIYAVIAILLILSVGVGLFFMHKNTDNGKNDRLICTDISLDTELVSVETLGNIAKIDCITPGLDTYSMRTYIYDINAGKTLSETVFEEALLESGITNNGFYVININERRLYLYDKNGNLTKEKDFTENSAPSTACGVSADERYFLCTDTLNGQIFIYDLIKESKTETASDYFFSEFLGTLNNKFILKSVSGEIIEVDPEKQTANAVLIDGRITNFAHTFSIGRTEHNFIAVDLKAGNTLYTPICTVDEKIVGIGKNGFATCVSTKEANLIRSYDIENKAISKVQVDGTVESVCYLEDGRLVAVAVDSESRQHRIYICTPTETVSLTVTDSDTPYLSPLQSTVSEAEPNNAEKVVENVPLIPQFPAFPTGCESVSAVMLLQFAGEDITTSRFVDEYLDKNSDFYIENGKRYGPSPWEHFIGDPRSSASYGCMASVIQNALIKYFGNSERVVDLSGTELDTVCSEYIDNDIPVMVWVTIGMLETNPKNTWYLSDGRRFSWPGNEHCMVLIGYDEQHYYFNDPYAGKVVKYNKQAVKDRYGELGLQALAVVN